MNPGKWKTLSNAEKAEYIRQQAQQSWSWGCCVAFTEREQSIMEYTAEDVSAGEIRNLLHRLRRSGAPTETIGKIRIHYDHLIDDAEKSIRQYLGLETDYSHKLTKCFVGENGRPFAMVDGIPLYIWRLLYLPEKAAKTKWEISQAIDWCEQTNRHEEREQLLADYRAVIEESKPPPPKLTTFELKLLDGIVPAPNNTSNLRRAIRRMEGIGFHAEAESVRQQYIAVLEPAPQLTPFEFRLLNEDSFLPGKGNLQQALQRMEHRGFFEEAEMVRQRHASILAGKSPELTVFENKLLSNAELPYLNPWHVRRAIQRMEASGFYDEAELVRQLYADLLAEKPPELTPYGLLLLDGEEFIPHNKGTVRRAIRGMERHGFDSEAEAVKEKYAWFLDGSRIWSKYTPEEVDARFDALLSQFR